METRHPRDLRPLDDDECWRLIDAAAVARVGFSTDEGPDVLPVNHLVHDGAIVFRSAPGSKLGVAAAGSRVAVEVDDYDAATHRGWSVVAYGEARIVTDADRLASLHAVDFEPWTAPDLRDHWIEIRPDRLSGRHID